MNLVQPGVIVVDYNDYRLRSWKVSRPRTSAHKVEDFERINFGLQDLEEAVVQFTSSALFRDLLTPVRPHAAWMQSSRNIGIENIPLNGKTAQLEFSGSVNKTVEDTIKIAWLNTISNYEKAQKATDDSDQDIGRLQMPIGHMSEWTYKAPMRVFIGLWKSLNEKCLEYRRTYLDPIFWHIYRIKGEELETEMLTGKWKNFDPIHPLYTINKDWKEGQMEFSGNKIINCTIPFSLHAQMVRHQNIKVRTDIWNWLDEASWFQLESQDLSTPVSCTIILSDEEYSRIAGKRSCWIAQFDLWNSFIKQEILNKGYENVLPCKGCKDNCKLPIEAKDCEERNAVTLPCPVYSGAEWFYKRMEWMKLNPIVDKEVLQIAKDYFDTKSPSL